jgi:hypothetical protein
MVDSKYPDFEYQAKLLYMNASSWNSPSHDRVYAKLNSKRDSMGEDHGEAAQLAKHYESIFGENTFTKFKTGELFERSIRPFNQPLACVSIHEPLSRPPVLSVIVQDPVDPQVSAVVCEVTHTINSYITALERKSMAAM